MLFHTVSLCLIPFHPVSSYIFLSHPIYPIYPSLSYPTLSYLSCLHQTLTFQTCGMPGILAQVTLLTRKVGCFLRGRRSTLKTRIVAPHSTLHILYTPHSAFYHALDTTLCTFHFILYILQSTLFSVYSTFHCGRRRCSI